MSIEVDEPFAADRSAVGMIRRWAREKPTATAVSLDGIAIDYATLERETDRLAARLIEAGAARGDLIALVTDRSPGFIVGMLGILKAGCGYVPLDPSYPATRLDFAIEDSGCRMAVGSGEIPYRIPFPSDRILEVPWTGLEAPGQDPEAPGLPDPDPDSVAYLIYTSGSTGTPKGVPITHRNLTFSTEARLGYYTDHPGCFFLTSSFAFDSSVAGIYWSLFNGAELAISPEGSEKDPGRLTSLLGETRATHVLLLPAMYDLILQQPEAARRLSSLECVIVAGEECPSALVTRHADTLGDVALYNEYGPTEATVWATVHRLGPADTHRRVPIGRAIPGAKIHLFDTSLAPVPDGEIGEIFIGGPGVAQGYHGRPGLTEERFVEDPTEPGARLYRTGDLGRWFPDGALEFLGRSDQQVKIRGFRVELGEIEAAIKDSSRVRDCVVALHRKPSGAAFLVAYVVMVDPSDEVGAGSALVSRPLPDPMIPSRFMVLEDFPRLPNGKVDRNALPAPDNQRPELGHPYAPAGTPLERSLVELWEGVLELEGVGIDDPFFELGGSSLAAASVVSKLEQTLGESIFVVTLFEAPTIRRFADLLRSQYAGPVKEHWPDEKIRIESTPRELSDKDFSGFGQFVPSVPPATAERHLQTEGHPGNDKALFILSPPRSGSTLLRVMLAGHPDLYAADELQLLGFDDMASRLEALSGRFDLWREGLLRTIMDLDDADVAHAQRIVADLERENATTAQVFQRLQDWAGGRTLVDKTTAYAMDPHCLQRAERDFSSPLYIHLVRHPYAAIRSFERMHMDQVLYLHQHTYSARELGELVWWRSNEIPRRFLASIDESRWYRIRFEDLVADPSAVMTGLCDRLGLSFHEGLVNPYDNIESKVVDGVHEESKPMGDVGLLKQTGINPAVGDSWKGVLEDDFLTEATWTLAEAFGYSRPGREVAGDRRSRRNRMAERRKRTRSD